MSEYIPSNTGLFKFIREKYNSKMVTTIRHYVRTSEKLASMKQHLHFNIRAKRYNIIPKSLKVNCHGLFSFCLLICALSTLLLTTVFHCLFLSHYLNCSH